MQYRIDKTEPRTDGSGEIAWDIWAVDDNNLVIPGKHMTILTPYLETQAALDAPNPAVALKALLVEHAGAGWDDDALTAIVAANVNAETVDGELDDFIDGVGGYPLTFSL